MLCCRITGLILDDGRKGNGVIDLATVTTILTYGNQKFFCESRELVAVGEKRMATFAQSFGFEILDCEKTDTISLAVTLVDCLGRNTANSSGRCIHRRQIMCETALSMAEFRHRQEEKIDTVVPVEFDIKQWQSTSDDIGSNASTPNITGELGLSLVYTDDIDEPSMAGFLACGLCLCPPMTLSTGSTTT